ncbi:aminoglycoside phosphotransferase family protein [Pseudobacteriovorax antillogorgiicola]|uniref:Aminoglycoside phosphotransferase domain-containing protein n=1 Tax=Pseudobacteriovorax antillogorgiicola TaxID=1513793 RepID=A0A1Y6B912_9BACT|nr:phosphotransferase [Pseudobacteriovorax antillogorgiicola]TCS59175.1 hypothetical protein EDD56_10178 [Pseudobacteriovorax antillogorgiicola]SME90880.1 hypothetical protein SAMN06296036_101408 [Pseudobacteriovorax antillogorgiicola]
MNKPLKDSFTSKKRGDALPPPPPSAICDALGVTQITIDWLAGDGSDRCYYRLFSPEIPSSLVLMQLSGQDAEALRENGYEWIQIGDILSQYQIFVPKTVRTMPDFAAIIIEDYGDIMMESVAQQALSEGSSDEVLELYRSSFYILKKFLKISGEPNAPWCKRKFDSERFQWELNFFRKEFLEPVAGIHLNHEDLKIFEEESMRLSDHISSSSDYFVHRDFHSRNIMVHDNTLAVIDFQDARYGPAAYDLVSLCFDSYVPLPNETRHFLLEEGIQILSDGDPALQDTLKKQWSATLLQRQIKAIGSFGYLSMKKNRGNYLKYVKPALNTLSSDLVYDERWPMLSASLLARIEQSIG